jgi:predicted transcriptional regulator of viral defense system
MHDMASRPDHASLFAIASEQHGYFSANQARASGFNYEALHHHASTGRFIRIRRGLYRLRDFPFSPYEDVAAAWLAIGKDRAVISHETALDVLDLSDVTPNAIHMTVPRSMRYLSAPDGVEIHTIIDPIDPTDTIVREGLRLTSPVRTILDSAETGTAPEHIEMAVQQALRRGLIFPYEIREASNRHGKRIADLVERILRGERV